MRTIIILSILLIFIFLYESLTYYLVINPYKKFKCNNLDINKLYNTLNNYPINLYYINLDTSTDRNLRFINKINNLNNNSNLNIIRIPAISPSTLPAIIKHKLYNPLSYNSRIFSCTSSHLKAIHTSYHNGDYYSIIAEDDIIILKNINWHYLIQNAPCNWDILQLHTCCIPFSTATYNPIYKYDKSNILFLYNNKMIPSTACYIINRKCMNKILSRYVPNFEDPNWDNIKKLNFTYTTKGYAADDLIYFNTNRYICTKMLIDVENYDSTIRNLKFSTHHITKKYIANNS